MRAKLGVSLVFLLAACTGTITNPGVGGDDDDDDDDIGPGPDASAPPDAEPVTLPAAPGIRVRDVAIYQTVEIALVQAHQDVSPRNAPVVEGAAGRIAVFVDVDPDWQPRPVQAELELEVAPGDVRTFTAAATVSAASGGDPDEAAFSIAVPGEVLTASARWAVTIRETTGASHPGSADGARWPAADRTPLGAESANGPLHLVLVPFEYNADGSGRLPPTDEAALQKYRDLFTAMYPVAEVELTVREPVPYSATIGAGSGWSSWLDYLTNLRDSDNPPANTYYYGIAAPRSTFGAYCSGGCIVGLGWVPGRNDEYGRAAVGVSFADSLNRYTAAHEVGHTMGRNHAPCGGPSGVDPGYPYSGAGIGVWGYDAIAGELKDPGDYTDVMGYCDTQWISDYTYEGIFERISYVNTLSAATNAPRLYRVALVDERGAASWRRYDEIQSTVEGEPIDVALLDADGGTTGHVAGHFYRYDHLGGGMLLVPVPDVAPAAVAPQGLPAMAW
jgi:hypothetical protein